MGKLNIGLFEAVYIRNYLVKIPMPFSVISMVWLLLTFSHIKQHSEIYGTNLKVINYK